jgi:hypothetical protein
MFNENNTTLVIQGNLYENWTLSFIETYKKYFKHIVLSTWDNETVDVDGIQIVKSPLPEITGPGNINCQLRSSLVGCQHATTEFIIKVRTDILIKKPEVWLKFFSNYWNQNRIFVLGLTSCPLFAPRDQIFAGSKEDMIHLFDIPFINSNYNPSWGNLFPELYIGAMYHSRFSETVKKFLEQPYDYLISEHEYYWVNPKKRNETNDEWLKLRHKYMYPVSKNLKYSWYKKFPNGEYYYDYVAETAGEYWHEDIVENHYRIDPAFYK